ncbi:MAG: hypothetical protein NC826_01290 [Candidatus Omnitrophica bacterium]|nr:hypothetical protein [Candidatus Omnitrophota bacterium]
MININLLPSDLRPKRKLFILVRFHLFLYFILGFILSIHIILFIMILFKNFQYSMLNRKWQMSKNELEQLEAWKKENEKMKDEFKLVERIYQQRVVIYPKLKALSKNIVDGIWYKHLKIKSKGLLLEGSIVAQEGQHMSVFRTFCDRLKGDNDFFKDLLSFEIGPLKTRRLSNNEILDFIIEAKLK